MTDYKWVRDDIDLTKINNQFDMVVLKNSGILEKDFLFYANNFLKAGNLITVHLVKCGKIAKLDTWYFALVYLYRQSLELLLKANIFLWEKDLNNRKIIIGNVRHDLKQCFDEIIKLSNFNVSSNNNVLWLSDFLEDIIKSDKSSDMFRYPFANNLNTLFGEQTHIDLVANYYNFNRAFDILNDLYQQKQFSNKKYDNKYCYNPKLIVEGGSYLAQSVVGYNYHQRSYYPYFTSYVECGKFLTDYIRSNTDDSLFMPMCYMFRNALELGLKRLIVEDSHLDTKKALRILSKKKHSLLGLWNTIYPEIKSCADSNGLVDINNALKYIDAFHNFDNSSDKFRYPCNKELEPYFVNETKLDVQNFSDCFIELSNFLDSANSVLANIKRYEAEMEYENQSYYR